MDKREEKYDPKIQTVTERQQYAASFCSKIPLKNFFEIIPKDGQNFLQILSL